MENNTPAGLQASGTDGDEQLSTETVEVPRNLLQQLLSRVETLEERVDALSEGNAGAHQRVEDVEERLGKVENAAEYSHERVDRVEAGLDGANPTPETSETGSSDLKSSENRDSTLSQITNLPQHLAEEQLSTNQLRARSIAKDVEQYSDRTPKGLVVSSSTVSKVLAAQEEGEPHTQTVSRVIDFLDEFGEEEVEARMHKGRRIAVFDEGAAQRYGVTSVSQGDVMGERASG